jgi:hypothetical protein
MGFRTYFGVVGGDGSGFGFAGGHPGGCPGAMFCVQDGPESDGLAVPGVADFGWMGLGVGCATAGLVGAVVPPAGAA